MRERKKYTVHGKIDYWFDNSQTKRNHNRSPKLSFLTQSAKHTSQYNMKELFFFCCSVLFWTRNGMYIFAWIWSLGKQLPLHATMHACSPRCCYPCMGKSIGSTTAELKRTTTVSIVEVQYLLRKEVLRRLLWLLACARDCCRILYYTWCRRVLQVDSNTTFFFRVQGLKPPSYYYYSNTTSDEQSTWGSGSGKLYLQLSHSHSARTSSQLGIVRKWNESRRGHQPRPRSYRYGVASISDDTEFQIMHAVRYDHK